LTITKPVLRCYKNSKELSKLEGIAMQTFPPLPADDTVLVLTHMQNEFAHPEGKGASIAYPSLKAADVFGRISRVLAACRQASIPVIYHNETYQPGHPELRIRRNGYVIGSARHFGLDTQDMAVRGTWGAQVVEELAPHPDRDEYVLDNSKVDPFTCTEFEVLLRNLDRHVLLLAGLATNLGIEMTARSGNEREYGICVLSDCIDRALGTYSDQTVETLLPLYGRVASADEIIAELTAQPKRS
jgi:nicotinamidase-related amidase